MLATEVTRARAVTPASSNSSDVRKSTTAMIPATAVTPAVAGMPGAAYVFCGDSRKNLQMTKNSNRL
jgi:hypothetical protein